MSLWLTAIDFEFTSCTTESEATPAMIVMRYRYILAPPRFKWSVWRPCVEQRHLLISLIPADQNTPSLDLLDAPAIYVPKVEEPYANSSSPPSLRNYNACTKYRQSKLPIYLFIYA
jgi:hypothetical protein